MLKLSVLVTFYNEKEYVKRAIDSVLNQDIGYPYEILIGDDGSSDGSYELAMELYGNLPQVTIVQQERDPAKKEYAERRHTRLIRRLMEMVKGEYFILLDGDDYYISRDCLKRKIEILDNPDNSDCVCAVSELKYLLEDGSYMEFDYTKKDTPIKQSLQDQFFGKDPQGFHVSTCMARSSILEQADQYTYYADQGLYFWIMNFGKRYYDHKLDFCHFLYDTSMQATLDKDQAKMCIEYLLGDDQVNCQWNYKYDKNLRKRNKGSHAYLFKNRKHLRELLDYDIWFEYAKGFNGYAYEFLNFDQLPMTKKIGIAFRCEPLILSNKIEDVWEKLSWNISHVFIVLGYMISPRHTLAEKKARLSKAKRGIQGERD